MKKSFLFVAIIATALTFSSCANGLVGLVYTDLNEPLTATSNNAGSKVGTSNALSVLGIVAVGDASIQKAAKEAGIKKISHVDTKTFSILGLFTKVETVVYGE